jgi:hypothetical protein
VIVWINRNKRLVQWLVVALGLLALGPTLYQSYASGLSGLTGREGEFTLKSLSKPAEVGIYALVTLYAVRLALKNEWVRKKAVALFRLLQVIHVPLGWVVFAAAALHGAGFLILNWKNDINSWSGIAALSLMSITVVFGLLTMKRPGRKTVHRVLGLTTFVVVIVHIFVPSGRDRGPGGPGFQGRRPPQGATTAPLQTTK